MINEGHYQQEIKERTEFFRQFIPDLVYVDKYPECTVQSALNKAVEQHFFNNNKSRISAGMLLRIKNTALKELRQVYGEYANILDLKMKPDWTGIKWNYSINFISAFKSSQGRLYGIKAHIGDNPSGLLITTHAIDRVKERTDINYLLCQYGKDRTALDLTVNLIIDGTSFRKNKDQITLTPYGYFITNNHIVKTFLNYNMYSEYQSIVNELLVDSGIDLVNQGAGCPVSPLKQ